MQSKSVSRIKGTIPPAEMHHLICDVWHYPINDLMVRGWVKFFNEIGENVHDYECSRQNGYFVCAVEGKIERTEVHHYITFSAFFKITRSSIHENILWEITLLEITCWVPKVITEQNKRNIITAHWNSNEQFIKN